MRHLVFLSFCFLVACIPPYTLQLVGSFFLMYINLFLPIKKKKKVSSVLNNL